MGSVRMIHRDRCTLKARSEREREGRRIQGTIWQGPHGRQMLNVDRGRKTGTGAWYWRENP